ncbi:uncharacterized protein [Henckelia pumila]|uniref:uncharacterized protein n=1 Tax=Henckelia pumila TaxID=405737 RepID=UPI003C6DBE1B
MDNAFTSIENSRPSIIKPTIAANHFEIKPAIIQMVQNTVQFGGMTIDDTYAHLENFLEICDTFKMQGVIDDAIRLRLFPFYLRDKAKAWLTNLPAGTLYEAWERYKDLLRRCPHHQLPDDLVVQTFYYGLPHSNRTMLDAAAGGNLLRKSPEDGYELIEEMTSSSYQPQSERSAARRPTGMHQVDGIHLSSSSA